MNQAKCINYKNCGGYEIADRLCYQCIKTLGEMGDGAYVALREKIDAEREAALKPAKKKKEKKPPVEGPDFYEIIADMVQNRHSFWYSGKSDLYYYHEEDGIWRPGGRLLINAEITEFRRDKMMIEGGKIAKAKLTTIQKEVTAIILGRLTKGFKEMPVPPKNLIPCKNGILDINTKELIPFSKDYFFTMKLPWAYDESAKCDQFDECMKDWFGSEYETGWEMIGLCLYRGYPIHKFFVLYSDGGQGKSTFMNILHGLLGYDNISAVPVQDLHLRFQAADLRYKLANIADELPKDKIKNTNMLKAASGNGIIRSDIKGQQGAIRFYSYATMIFSLNPGQRFPESADDSDGFYRRIHMINMDGAKNSVKKPIAELDQKIIANKAEMEGILLRGIEALLRLKGSSWTMSNQKSAEEARRHHMMESSPISLFIENWCETGGDYQTRKEFFRKCFAKWLKAEGKKGYSDKAIKQAMDEKGILEERKMEDYERVRYWDSLRIDWKRLDAWLEFKSMEATEEEMEGESGVNG
jgi:putative DNA primase/helicase